MRFKEIYRLKKLIFTHFGIFFILWLVENFFNGKSIHFIGIGGISMQALAKFSIANGAIVSGSDLSDSDRLVELKNLGAEVYVGSNAEYIQKKMLIVKNSAIKPMDKELERANELGLEIYERHEILGLIASMHKKVIAVSGTHGKTTVTALLTSIFNNAGKQFSAHIGGDVVGFSNMYIGGYDYFITEACEYAKNFLNLKPDYSVILNIENDHPDSYKNFEDLENCFAKFMENTKKGGAVFCPCKYQEWFCDKNMISVQNTIFDEGCSVMAQNIKHTSNGRFCFDVLVDDKKWLFINSNMVGIHNVWNILSAIAVAKECGIEKESIVKGIADFVGVKRRYEKKGTINGVPIIFDYAHHPSEIEASLDATNSFAKKILVVFQPHTFSRTKSLINEFARCFVKANTLLLLPTYPARETEKDGMTTVEMKDNLMFDEFDNLKLEKCCLIESLEKSARIVQRDSWLYDCVLFLGAGDIISAEKMLDFD